MHNLKFLRQMERVKINVKYCVTYLHIYTNTYRYIQVKLVKTGYFQYELIMATIWRYVYAQRSKLCMYGGEILDDYAVFVRQYLLTPRNLCISNKTKHYVNTSRNRVPIFTSIFEPIRKPCRG